MGRLAAVLSYIRTTINGAQVTDVKVDPGGGANVTAHHFAPVGDDSPPLVGDIAVLVAMPRTGSEAVVGYLDPINIPLAQAGEKRTIARDQTTGITVVELWLKNDGSALLSNALGSIALLTDGSVNINGVTIDAAGNVTVPSSLSLNGKELDAHVHLAGTPPGNTGPNT